MKINAAQFKADGQKYIDTIFENLKDEAWENLKFAKFQTSSPEELEMMKTLWSHGFTRGAEAATQLSIDLYTSLNPVKP